MICSRRISALALCRVRGHSAAMLLILLWALLALVLGAALWYKTLSGIETDQRTLASTGLQNAATLARGYAQFATRTLEHFAQHFAD